MHIANAVASVVASSAEGQRLSLSRKRAIGRLSESVSELSGSGIRVATSVGAADCETSATERTIENGLSDELAVAEEVALAEDVCVIDGVRVVVGDAV